LELGQAVEQRGDLAEVAEEIADPGPDHPRCHTAIAAYGRQHYPLIEAIVEVVHAPVQGFPGIMDIQRLEGGAFELALIESRIELQGAQWIGEPIGIGLCLPMGEAAD